MFKLPLLQPTSVDLTIAVHNYVSICIKN